jgi:hypothetical protein
MEKLFICQKRCKRISENLKEYQVGDAISLNEKEAKAFRKEGIIGQFDAGKSASAKPAKPVAKKKATKKK